MIDSTHETSINSKDPVLFEDESMENGGLCGMMRWGNFTVYDRMEWYASNGLLFEQARERFAVLMQWLDAHGMLNTDGNAAAKEPIPDDFSLSDGLLTEQGTQFLAVHYESWLFSGGTSDPIDTKLLDEAVQ